MKVFGVGLLLFGLLSACATTASLGTAANRLDDSAQRFYLELQRDPGFGHTDSDAAILVAATHDFERAVNGSRSQAEVRPAFDRVAERYHHLRARLGDRDYYDRYQRAGFDRVTQAYLDVDRAMNHPDSRYHD